MATQVGSHNQKFSPGKHTTVGQRSFWLETTEAPPQRPRAEGNAQADIAIIGGGFAGLSSACDSRLIAAGLSSSEVAERLVIAVGTVRNHVKNIYGKLDTHNRLQAVERARTLGLLR